MTLAADGLDEQGCCSECQRVRSQGHNSSCADNPTGVWAYPKQVPGDPPAIGAEQEAVDDAAAQLLIELAFLVPRGTDLEQKVGPQLEAYKLAIEKRSCALGQAHGRAEREPETVELWGVFDGGDLQVAYPRKLQADCYANSFSPAAQSRITVKQVAAAIRDRETR